MLNYRGAQLRTPRPGKMPNEEKCTPVRLKSTNGWALELGRGAAPFISTRDRSKEFQVTALSGHDARCLYDDHASGDHFFAVHTIVHCGLRANSQFAFHRSIFINHEMNDVGLGVLQDV